MTNEPIDRDVIVQEYEHARALFHELLRTASTDDLRRGTEGTKWNNEQMLFHMLFGYLVVATLLPLVHIFERLPDRASTVFAKVLRSFTRPFHMVNYLGSCTGVIVFNHQRMGRRFDKTISALERRLRKEPEAHLVGGMHFPRGCVEAIAPQRP